MEEKKSQEVKNQRERMRRVVGKNRRGGWGCRSVVECYPNSHETLDLSHSTAERSEEGSGKGGLDGREREKVRMREGEGREEGEEEAKSINKHCSCIFK